MSTKNRTQSPKPTKVAKDDDKTDKAAAAAAAAAPASTSTEKKDGRMKNATLAIGVALVGIILCALVGDKKKLQELTTGALNYIESQGNFGYFIYHVLLFLQILALIPITPLEIAGGFLFKDTYGLVCVSTTVFLTKFAANIGSVFFARHFMRDWVRKTIVDKFELLQLVEKAMSDEPYKMSFLVRGAMIPLGVKNYGLGVMDVGYLPICAGSLVFTPVYGFRNIYLGSTCSELAEIFSPKKTTGPATWTDIIKKTLPIVFNVLLVIFTIKILMDQIKKYREKIEKNLKEKEAKKAK